MTRLIETATTSLDPATAFAHVGDFANIDRWDPGVVNAEKVTSGPAGVGTTYGLTLSYGGPTMTMEYRVLELDPDRRIVLEGTGARVHAIDTISFEPVGTGTKITYQADLRLTGIARLAQPFMKSRFAKIGDGAGKGLRKWLAELETAQV
jgi:carbon monoxide dehydrogenase subunit G